MLNRAMKEELDKGECLDVLGERLKGQAADAGVWEIAEYVDGVDYCVAESEQWVWSIGKRNSDGKIFASTDARFYQNPDYECLWLR